ncbi:MULTISPECIES: site-specific DNA-methyltransferase [Acetobacter]|uniref:site-specific DNA-methyltransferase (adenine-specific) n=2 Tax=Acetobacter TaxID=434 RepID=A0AAN1U899_9PROT|nr:MULTISPECIES: site-specific DNA-methyltransferase [Acetobacter]ASL41088.1 site-specific DNA-methyltransferase [Acetobacter oryzifermentans]AXM99588.1 site-specific DNA-methyltransferase [Acetobacter pomorum]KAA8394203.1 site-specific DNA-methyltransferase [Acetobacter sp. DmW_125127]KAA8395983.1 site-specific DNA-methyltransferase [Acetobacter sp. DmW_125124]KAA8399786.1 site-specific DNA-methyltransferase [Acetobacter sp. DmW_125128]
MTNKQNPKFQELVAKLREIFQIDRPELDFGIYRILNARAGEINDYLQNRLAEKVQEALSAGSAASAQQLQAELQEAEKNAQALGVSPDAVPKVQELRTKLKEATAGSSEHENAVFSHLLAFFSRYYEQGDFISQRRYKGDTYAIPYAGEEVMLHWANKDQYYTKSGENFSNYSFKLEDGRTVHFRLAAADTAKDNRKDNDKERRFALVAAKTVTRMDENGDEYEKELVPVEEVAGKDGKRELIVRFEYSAQPKGTKQDALVTKAVAAVLADAAVKARWLALGNRAPTEKNPQRTLLEKHLSDYTTKNTADYFIHKDLGGFLRRELDFYVKNEVMHLDDVQNAGAFADIEKNLRMIQCLRSIALELITFLAQLEDFQKKLWLKKKFVVSSHYCITLDRVPEFLYPTIAANQRQWDQWASLKLLKDANKDFASRVLPDAIAFIKANPHLSVDTSLFDKEFLAQIIALIDDLDSCTDGILIKGDNFQAIQLISQRFKGAVDYIYLDPPYNTSENSFIYKNQYKESSWLSMIQNRIAPALNILKESGVMSCAIDDFELPYLEGLLDAVFQPENRLGNLVVEIKPSGRTNDKYLATSHEYLLFYAKNAVDADINFFPLSEEQAAQYSLGDGEGNFKWRDFLRTGGYSTPQERPNSYYPIFFNPETKEARLEEFEGAEKILPIDSEGNHRVWRKTPPSFLEHLEKGEINFSTNRRGEWKVQIIDRIKDGTRPKSVWVNPKYDASSHGTKLLKALFGEGAGFSFPKSINAVEDALYINCASKKGAYVVDYFAGSGTTGHALINMNRKDSGSRKYLLVEQGDYFDAVIKPRIQKVVYCPTWKDGRPSTTNNGISHTFKVLYLESYEDTLNNLQLRRTSAQGNLLNTLPQQAKDDYLLNYQLDVESRGSLLSVEDFRKPFDYTLNVAVDSAGAFEPRKIDLVETFNFLIGLRVKHIDAQPQRGFVTVTGTLPSHGASPSETCLVLWRDCDVLDYEGVSKLCDKLAINPADNEFDVVYINGDHNIPTVLTQTAEEGGATRVLKLRQIEPEFLERMFSVEDI